MTSAVFSGYLEEHSELCASIGRSIAQLRSLTDLNERRSTQASVETELIKADELLQQMDLEARSAPKVSAREMQARAKSCRDEIKAMRVSLKQALISGIPQSSERGGGGGSNGGVSDDEVSENDRARLLKMGERLHDGTNKLKTAMKVALEAEQIGESIMGDLRSQRETIMHATGTMQRANESLSRSKRTLSAISQRALSNKVLMWVLIVLLVLAVVFLLYIEIVGVSSSSSSSSHNRTHG